MLTASTCVHPKSLSVSLSLCLSLSLILSLSVSLSLSPCFLPDRSAIFFNSHNVSKPESSSALTSVRLHGNTAHLPDAHCHGHPKQALAFFPLQRDNVEGLSQPPSDDVIRELSRSLRQSLAVSLFGIDVIINNQTGQHAVIDINAFPGEPRPPRRLN